MVPAFDFIDSEKEDTNMLKIFLFLTVLFPSLVFGGEIYGTIKIGKRPVGEGTKVEIVCGGKTYTQRTDKYGSYSIYVEGKGQGTLKVHYPVESGHAPSISIFSYEKNAARYDLVIVTDPQTRQPVLERK
jgi:hypothetical protein